MKSTIYIILFTVACFAQDVLGQEIYKNKGFDFSINQPKDWFIIKDRDLDYNLKGVHGRHLVSYSKYDTSTHIGLNPIISITVGSNYMSFNDFSTKMMKEKTWRNKDLYKFSAVQNPQIIEIDSIKSIFTFEKYTISNKPFFYLVRKRSYMIPYGKHMFYIDFVDGQNSEDETKLFDEIVKSIKFGK